MPDEKGYKVLDPMRDEILEAIDRRYKELELKVRFSKGFEERVKAVMSGKQKDAKPYVHSTLRLIAELRKHGHRGNDGIEVEPSSPEGTDVDISVEIDGGKVAIQHKTRAFYSSKYFSAFNESMNRAHTELRGKGSGHLYKVMHFVGSSNYKLLSQDAISRPSAPSTAIHFASFRDIEQNDTGKIASDIGKAWEQLQSLQEYDFRIVSLDISEEFFREVPLEKAVKQILRDNRFRHLDGVLLVKMSPVPFGDFLPIRLLPIKNVNSKLDWTELIVMDDHKLGISDGHLYVVDYLGGSVKSINFSNGYLLSINDIEYGSVLAPDLDLDGGARVAVKGFLHGRKVA